MESVVPLVIAGLSESDLSQLKDNSELVSSNQDKSINLIDYLDSKSESICNDIRSFNLYKEYKRDDETSIYMFYVDAVYMETVIGFCEKLQILFKGSTIWCHLDSGEGYEHYIKGDEDGFQNHYVDSDGGDDETYPTNLYADWHEGLPESLHFGCLSCLKEKELFSQISDALDEGKSIAHFIKMIHNLDNINFVSGYNEDAFTYIYDYGNLKDRETTLKLLEAIYESGYNVNNIIDNIPLLIRILAINIHSRDDESTLSARLDILRFLVNNGANPNFVSSDKDFYEEYNVLQLSDCDTEQADGYFTILNVMAGQEWPQEAYSIILPYCKPDLLRYAIRWSKKDHEIPTLIKNDILKILGTSIEQV